MREPVEVNMPEADPKLSVLRLKTLSPRWGDLGLLLLDLFAPRNPLLGEPAGPLPGLRDMGLRRPRGFGLDMDAVGVGVGVGG